MDENENTYFGAETDDCLKETFMNHLKKFKCLLTIIYTNDKS